MTRSISARQKPRRAPAPPAIQLLRLLFATLGRVLPGPMSRIAYRLWFATRRFPLSAREREILGRAERFEVQVNGERVVAYRWGSGPAVLLVHGWHGAAANFIEFVEPLTRAGFCAVAFDAPAHGESPGERTTLPEIVDAMAAIGAKIGPFEAVVAHSFGVICTTWALVGQRIAATKVVCISAPAHFDGLFVSFSDTLALPSGIQHRFRRRLEHDFGADIWARLSPEHLVQSLRLPALIVHDTEDRSVPIAESEALARAWPGSRLLRTARLGHRRILADRAVIDTVVDFIGQERS